MDSERITVYTRIVAPRDYVVNRLKEVVRDIDADPDSLPDDSEDLLLLMLDMDTCVCSTVRSGSTIEELLDALRKDGRLACFGADEELDVIEYRDHRQVIHNSNNPFYANKDELEMARRRFETGKRPKAPVRNFTIRSSGDTTKNRTARVRTLLSAKRKRDEQQT